MKKNYMSNEKFIKAIEKTGGIIFFIQKNLEKEGIILTRKELIEQIEKRKAVKEAIEQEKERIKDLAEKNIMEAIEQKDIKTTLEYLKNQAKGRGWGECQVNIQGLDKEIKIKFIDKTEKNINKIQK